MEDDKSEPLAELASEAAFEAAFAHQHFLAAIVTELVAAQALPSAAVVRALNEERAFIEALRPEGGRLSALANEQLAASLQRMLSERGYGSPQLPPWRVDPDEPAWPHYPWSKDETP